MSEMIERVARALATHAGDPDDGTMKDFWEGYARTAIEAMRGATNEMAQEAINCDGPPHIMWEVMIDEVLK